MSKGEDNRQGDMPEKLQRIKGDREKEGKQINNLRQPFKKNALGER